MNESLTRSPRQSQSSSHHTPLTASSTASPLPPGLLPPGLKTSLPPGLPTAAAAGSSSSHPSVPTSLPPGLVPPQTHAFDTSPWSGTFEVALETKFAQAASISSPKAKTDVLSTFSPNFTITSRSSIFSPCEDPFYSAPDLSLSTSYSGTFNPFADFDSFEPVREDDARTKSAAENNEEPFVARRGSRFGFARRESGVNPGLGFDGPASSPLRSIFSNDAGDPPGPSTQPHYASSNRPTTRPDRSMHLSHEVSGESTPDASVLFPGVNLAASYSANALPAALARSMKSPTTTSARPTTSTPPSAFQSSGHGGMMASYDRLPATFNPRTTATSPSYSHSHHPHEHLMRNDGQTRSFTSFNQEMSHDFQDPAILNMRMANGTYTNHELYPQFSNPGFNPISSRASHFNPSVSGGGGGGTNANQELLNHYGAAAAAAYNGLHPVNRTVQSPHAYYNVSSQGLR